MEESPFQRDFEISVPPSNFPLTSGFSLCLKQTTGTDKISLNNSINCKKNTGTYKMNSCNQTGSN